ncbi:MAG: S8 family peptidase [Planctomycetota bacterium]
MQPVLAGFLALLGLAGSAPALTQGLVQGASPSTRFFDATVLPWLGGSEVWDTTSADIASELDALVRGTVAQHVLVRHGHALLPENRRLLAKLGVTLVQSAGRGFSFARLDAGSLDAAAVAKLGLVLDARAITVADKLHPLLLADALPDWTLSESRDGQQLVAAYVVMHADLLADPGGYELLLEFGADVKSTLITLPAFVVELPRNNIAALAARDEVMWIEPPLPRMGVNSVASVPNNSTRIITQVDQLQAAPYNLSGAGVKVLVYDGGTAQPTPDLSARLTARDNSGGQHHATHVAGTIGGDGSQSGGTYRGMAPAVTLESYGFEHDGTGVFLYSNPGDIEADYLDALTLHGVVVANNSIGSNLEQNNGNCFFQGDYGVTSSVVDATVRGGLTGTPFRVVWSAGNERAGSTCDIEGYGDFYSLAPPAAAKNPISVGAVDSNSDAMTYFSSWGPSDDGRLKPDVVAPGCETGGDHGVTSTVANGGYATYCGTSMAAPAVTGITALLLEDHRAQFGGQDLSNATLKSLLMHTAVDLGTTGPDYRYGYGSVRARAAVDELRRGQFVVGAVEQGDAKRYFMDVAPGSSNVKLTLAWDDVPATPGVSTALVNDLDLAVFDPSGVQRFPWTLNPNSPSFPALQTTADHRNNAEQVFVAAPISGTWTIEVRGFDVPAGPQDFSLGPSHALDPAAAIELAVVGALPDELELGLAKAFAVDVIEVNDTLVPGSARLHVSYAGGPFASQPLTHLGGTRYEAVLPGPACGAFPRFYLSVQGALSGQSTLPPSAPAASFATTVDTASAEVVVFADDFEAHTGWTTANIAITGGAWSRGFPLGGGDREDPPSDSDGSGRCFLTDGSDGDTDVDGGPTQLFSPQFALAGSAAYVRYHRWFGNDDVDQDRLDVHVSNDGGGGWTLVESVPDQPTWVPRTFRVAEFVTPTDQVQVRFSATDNPNDSVTEAGIDAFRVFVLDCTLGVDCDGDGIEDASAISGGFIQDANGDGIPDVCVGDCDDDGVPDDQEIDCDDDGIPDDCETDWLTHYGVGTAGTNGVVPMLDSTGGAPSIGTSDFTFVAGSLAPNRPSLLALDFSPANVAILGATALVSPVTALRFAQSTGAGAWSLAFPLADNPALIGLPFFAQVFVLDPGAPGGLAASDGVEGAVCGN